MSVSSPLSAEDAEILQQAESTAACALDEGMPSAFVRQASVLQAIDTIVPLIRDAAAADRDTLITELDRVLRRLETATLAGESYKR